MAFKQALSATDHQDLVTKLYDFLTTDADLVLAGQEWTIVSPIAPGISEVNINVSTGNDDLFEIFDDDPSTLVSFDARLNPTVDIVIELGEPMALTGFSMYEGNPEAFTFDYWNGTSWVTVASDTGLDDTVPDRFYKYTWASAGAHTRWRVRGTDWRYDYTLELRQWALYTGALSDQQVPLGGLSFALQAPGIPGYARPYVEVKTLVNTGDSYWSMVINQGTYQNSIVGNMSSDVVTRLQDGPITYWFVANGRRCMGVCKTGGVYEPFFFGGYLPYNPAAFHPYPGFVGASVLDYKIGLGEPDPDGIIRGWPDPHMSAYVFNPMNNWQSVHNWVYDSFDKTFVRRGVLDTGVLSFIAPQACEGSVSFGGGSEVNLTQLINAPGANEATLFPLIVYDTLKEQPNVYGELEGAYWVPGRGVASEDLVTINTVDYVIFQNTNKIEFDDFFALRME